MAKHRKVEDEDEKTEPTFTRLTGDLNDKVIEPKSDRIGECSTGRDSAPEYT